MRISHKILYQSWEFLWVVSFLKLLFCCSEFAVASASSKSANTCAHSRMHGSVQSAALVLTPVSGEPCQAANQTQSIRLNENWSPSAFTNIPLLQTAEWFHRRSSPTRLTLERAPVDGGCDHNKPGWKKSFNTVCCFPAESSCNVNTLWWLIWGGLCWERAQDCGV